MVGELEGTTVLVPRAEGQAGQLSGRIRELGGEPLEAPTIAIGPGDVDALAGALRDVAVGTYAAVCFTSPNGVVAVADALDGLGLDARAFAGVTIASVGPGTAGALRARLGLRADLVPEESTTAALGAAFPAGSGRVLLPRADIATAALPHLLRARGYEPVTVAAYVTGTPAGLPDTVVERLSAGEVDLLAFTSASTVRNFAALVEDLRWSGRVVTIGPVTSQAARELGLEVDVEASRHDLDGLVDALVRAVRSPSSGNVDAP